MCKCGNIDYCMKRTENNELKDTDLNTPHFSLFLSLCPLRVYIGVNVNVSVDVCACIFLSGKLNHNTKRKKLLFCPFSLPITLTPVGDTLVSPEREPYLQICMLSRYHTYATQPYDLKVYMTNKQKQENNRENSLFSCCARCFFSSFTRFRPAFQFQHFRHSSFGTSLELHSNYIEWENCPIKAYKIHTVCLRIGHLRSLSLFLSLTISFVRQISYNFSLDIMDTKVVQWASAILFCIFVATV